MQMLQSLRQIRNSASKKKAEKIFKNLDQDSTEEDTVTESGIYSMRGDDMDDPAIKRKRLVFFF